MLKFMPGKLLPCHIQCFHEKSKCYCALYNEGDTGEEKIMPPWGIEFLEGPQTLLPSRETRMCLFRDRW